MEQTIKNKKITIENLLYLLIIICPILDISSFLFRNHFNTSISISTFVRPIIPIIAFIYLYIKTGWKKPLTAVGILYGVYALCHLYIFYRKKTPMSYGNEIREVQYLVNYTFMIMNLFIYWTVFAAKNRENNTKKETLEKLKLSVLISLTLYIAFMYIALITGTSSFTYEETQTGYKGWFESGNSVGTLMLLALFIVIPMMSKKNKNYIRIWSFFDTVLAGVYLATMLGTRTGLFGFILVIVAYAIINIFYGLFHQKKINKKMLISVIIILMIIAGAVLVFGTKTIERRKQLRSGEDGQYDDMTEATSHVTGDILNLVKQIKSGTLEEGYMSYDEEQAMLQLYEIANKYEISNSNMRALQFIYHSCLVKQQNSIPMLLFGNGYMTHFYEMVFEMEVPAFLYNFGVIGFFLYFMPFLAVAIYGVYVGKSKIKQITVEYAMKVAGLCFAIIMSFLSGYTFFSSSTMMIIIILAVLTIDEIKDMEEADIKIYEGNKK